MGMLGWLTQKFKAPRASQFIRAFLAGQTTEDNFGRNFVDGYVDYGAHDLGFEGTALDIFNDVVAGADWHDEAIRSRLALLAEQLEQLDL